MQTLSPRAWMLGCVVASSPLAAAAQDVALSTEAPAQLGSVNFENDALVEYDPATNAAAQVFDLDSSFPEIDRNLDAVHMLPRGTVLASTQASDTVGALSFTESDILELDPVAGTATLFLDASAIGLTGNNNTVANINAVHLLADGRIAFSTASNDGVTLLGTSYSKDDVIAYDPAANTASLLFDGSLISGDEPDLQGFAVLDNGDFLLAAFNGGTDSMTLAGQTFTRDDIVRYDPVAGTASLYMEGLVEFSSPGEIIYAITPSVIPEPASAALLALGSVLLVHRRR